MKSFRRLRDFGYTLKHYIDGNSFEVKFGAK